MKQHCKISCHESDKAIHQCLFLSHVFRRYETSDGQKRNEVGYFRDDEKLGRILNVRGSYEYVDTNGKLIIVRYVADENGYRQEEGGPSPLPSNGYVA